MSFHDELVAQTARERNGLLSVPIIQSALAGRIASLGFGRPQIVRE